MERYTRKVEKNVSGLADFIFQNAMGNVVVLPKAPTKDEMKSNTVGYFNNKIYFRLANGELKELSVTDIP